MNPGLFNKRIKFFKETVVQNEFAGSETSMIAVPNVSPDAADQSATFGSLEPIRQYNQFAIEAGASILNGDRILKIRRRAGFYPSKDMIFQDISDPSNASPDTYTIVTVLPYWPGTKSAFQNSQESAYHDQYFIYIIGVKRS